MAETIYLTNVRLSFPKLIEAAASKMSPEGKKTFGADFLMPMNDDNFAKFMGEIGRVATEKWKDQASSVLQTAQGNRLKRCYGAGNEKIKVSTGKIYEGYEGMAYISASSTEDRPPRIIRADGSAIDNQNTMERKEFARKIYGGCYVNAAVRPWLQDNQFGKALRCELLAVQFLKDGTAFGEGSGDDGLSGFGAVAVPAAAPMAEMPFPAFMMPAAR